MWPACSLHYDSFETASSLIAVLANDIHFFYSIASRSFPVQPSCRYRVEVDNYDLGWLYRVIDSTRNSISWDFMMPTSNRTRVDETLIVSDNGQFVLVEFCDTHVYGARLFTPAGLVASWRYKDLFNNTARMHPTMFFWDDYRFEGCVLGYSASSSGGLVIQCNGPFDYCLELHRPFIWKPRINSFGYMRFALLTSLVGFGVCIVLQLAMLMRHHIIALKRLKRQRRWTACTKCGYCVMHLHSDSCPECGTAIPEEQRAKLMAYKEARDS
jgi:hypothetical protein